MSDEPVSPYGRQWFYGPAATAVAAKATIEADPRCVLIYPDRGEPPRPVDLDGVDAAFLVAFLVAAPISSISGLKRASGSFGAPVLGDV